MKKKIPLIEAVRIYNSLQQMANKEMDYSTAHAMVMTKAELEPHIQFFAERERALLEAFAEKGPDAEPITDEMGRYTVPKASMRDFEAEREKLNAVEVELRVWKLKTLPERITPAQLETLVTAFELPVDESEVDVTDG